MAASAPLQRPVALLVTCAALLAANTEAFAGSAAASASLTNIRFEVVDLDLNDGIEAGFSLSNDTDTWVGLVLSGRVEPSVNGPLLEDEHRADNVAFAPLSLTRTLLGASATATVGADFLTSAASAQTKSSSPPVLRFQAFSWVAPLGLEPDTFISNLSVAPNTRLRVAGDARTSADASSCAVSSAGYECDTATAQVVMRIDQTDFPDDAVTSSVLTSLVVANGNQSRSDSRSGTVELTFINDSSTDVYSTQLSIGTVVNGAAVSPVPEPSSYGLMLVGMAAVVGVARRRRRQLAVPR